MEQVVFGVDIGGTTVKIGLFEATGTLMDKWEIPTRTEEDGKEVLPDIAKSIEAKLSEKSLSKEQVIGVGVGIPGPVDSEGIVHGAVNLGWGKIDLDDALGNLIGLKVKAANDANIAALGEMWKGGGQGYKDVVAVTLGTGVGGGVIANGQLIAGFGGGGGEIGHLIVNHHETVSCNCGHCGCLEQYSSATGVVRLAKEALAVEGAESVLKGQDVTAKAVWDAVKAGDCLAESVADKFGFYLGSALASIAAVVNPEIFVFGGGVSNAGEIMFPYIQKYYDKAVFRGCVGAKFALAQLGNDAGIYGAAKLVIG